MSMENQSFIAGELQHIRSIRFPLIGVIILAVLIPSAISNYFTSSRGYEASEMQAGNQLESIVTLKADMLDLWLDDLQHSLASITEDQDLVWYVNDIATKSDAAVQYSRIQAHNILNRYTSQARYFENLFVLSLQGHTLVTTESEVEEVNLRLSRESGAQSVDPRFRGRVNFNQAATTPLILPMTWDATEQKLRLTLFYPVVNESGTTVAIVGGDALLDTLYSIVLERSGLGEKGETFLVDDYNNLLTDTLYPEEYPIGETKISTVNSLLATLMTTGGDTSQASRYENYRGQEVIGNNVWLPRLRTTLIAEIDAAEATIAITEVVNTNTALAAVAVILTAVGGIWFVNRRIITPLTRLTTTTTRIRNGDLEVRANVSSNDEFGLLAESFNSMTSHLNQVIVTERTTKQRLEAIVNNYVGFVQRVAQGDLTSHIDLDQIDMTMLEGTAEDLYILGSNLNGMVDSLRSMTYQIHRVSEEIISAASDIQVAVMQQTSSATEQDAAVTQTVATVEEVLATVQQTAERAQQVADTSQQSVEVSRMGQQAVAENAAGMNVIRERVSSIAETILNLSERTQQIGEIIDTVNALADQSKLLALNASIEAARAGQEGRGFAVVAMEVRQLAEQSREATARVSDIIDEIRNTTNSAVMVTEEGSKGAAAGMTLVERAGEAIRELSAAIEEAAQAAMQIAASTHQQTNGMDQLAAAMTQFKQASEQTADSTRQTEQSIGSLLSMAEQLEQAASRYHLGDVEHELYGHQLDEAENEPGEETEVEVVVSDGETIASE